MIDASSGPATSIEPEGVAGAGVRRLGRSLVAIVAAVSMVVGPIPVVQAQTSQPSGEISAAGKAGEAFAKSGKEGAASIPDQAVTGDVIPGYSTAPRDLSSLFGTEDRSEENTSALQSLLRISYAVFRLK